MSWRVELNVGMRYTFWGVVCHILGCALIKRGRRFKSELDNPHSCTTQNADMGQVTAININIDYAYAQYSYNQVMAKNTRHVDRG